MTTFLDRVDEVFSAKPTLAAVVQHPAAAGSNPAYVDAAVNRELERVRTAAEGTRNSTLNEAAFNLGQFVGAGHLDFFQTGDALFAAATDAGLTKDEAHKTIRSGLRAGEKQPRDVPQPNTASDVLTAIAPAGTPRVTPPVAAVPAQASGSATTPAATEPEANDDDHTTWWPRDIAGILAGDHDEPPPAFLARVDGHRLFYAGKVNGLLGESESGKTWIALLAVLQAIQVSERVLILDFEDSARGVLGRLRDMGATDEHLRHLAYVGPEETLHAAANADLAATLTQHTPALILVDGVNAAMTLLGLDLESNKDSTAFAQLLLRPLAATGAAVVTVDHVPKNKEQRGKGGIGAQAKRAMVTGCAITVEVLAEFGRGMTGRMRLTVDKDRPGRVRAVSAGARTAGTAVLESHRDGAVRVYIEAPDLRPADERGPFRPTHLMEKVSRFIESFVDGNVTRNVIENGRIGKKEFVVEALERLVAEGYVRRTTGPRNSSLHNVMRPFREDAPPPPDLPPTSPGGSDDGPSATSPHPLSPYGEGGGREAGGGDVLDDMTSPRDDPWWQR